MQPRTRSRSVYIAIIFVLLCWATVGIAILGRDALFDWWRLRGYTPPAQVAQLATDTTMNDGARRMFYAYHPSVEDSDAFNSHCRDNEFTIVLGCYVQYKGIYIFNIDDPRLEGVQQVTAAHELLHAAYDRLSNDEKKRIDALTAKTYEGLQDQRIRKTIEDYRAADPASVPSELHSILATEVRTLPDDLEEYYAHYFTDRLKIVAYSEQYEAAFSTRTSQIDTLKKDIDTLKSDITFGSRELTSQGEYLQRIGSQLQQRAANGQASQSEIDSYNRKVDDYNTDLQRINSLIRSYNAKLEQYNALVGEQQELMKELDSRSSSQAVQ